MRTRSPRLNSAPEAALIAVPSAALVCAAMDCGHGIENKRIDAKLHLQTYCRVNLKAIASMHPDAFLETPLQRHLSKFNGSKW